MHVLDTDTLTHLLRGHPRVVEEGWWTEAKAQHLLQHLATLARRARSRDLPLLLALVIR